MRLSDMRALLQKSAILLTAIPLLAMLFLYKSVAEAPLQSSTVVVPVQPATVSVAAEHKAAEPIQTPATPLLAVVDQPNIREEDKKIANEVLLALPSYCRNHLKNFYIRYDADYTQRAQGGKTTIIVSGREPFRALLVHECGHVTHGNAVGSPKSGMSNFKDGETVFYNDSPFVAFASMSWKSENVMKQDQPTNAFISGYAYTDAFEEFAETYAAVLLFGKKLLTDPDLSPTLKAKVEWMNRFVGGPLPQADTTYDFGKDTPWDVTKLPFMWLN